MRFMTTILEKTVILCAQVYLLAITLMILGLRWWQTMAMKDFQAWVLATCSLPTLPALDTLDEAILSPSLPAFQHSRHSSSSTHNWMMWGPTPHLISKAILHISAEGPTREQGNQGGCKEWGDGVSPEQLSFSFILDLETRVLSLPGPQLPFSSPRKSEHQDVELRVLDLGGFTGLWLENLQGLECIEPFSHTLSENYDHQIIT